MKKRKEKKEREITKIYTAKHRNIKKSNILSRLKWNYYVTSVHDSLIGHIAFDINLRYSS